MFTNNPLDSAARIHEYTLGSPNQNIASLAESSVLLFFGLF